MVRVLDALRKQYDLVVIDTPPLAHVADAISLLRHVDGVLVAASVNSTRGPDANRLRDQLQSLDARVLGVVANGGSAMHGYSYAPRPYPSARDQRRRPGRLVRRARPAARLLRAWRGSARRAQLVGIRRCSGLRRLSTYGIVRARILASSQSDQFAQ